MAANSYAKRLTPRSEKGGGLGNPEREETAPKAAAKMIQVATLLKASRKTVVLTGAGISTSAGVADFRGPNGVWTAEKHGKPPPASADFDQAMPTATHMALVALVQADLVHLVVSQNVDALHMRSGLPRDKLAELHGNIFLEKCKKCDREHLRDFDVGGMSFKPTGRRCSDPSCNGVLIDQLLDWDDALPEEELQRAENELSTADLAICLGTSLRIKPASELPLLATRNGGKLVICNLQVTPKDRHAHITVRTPVDDFFLGVLALLDIPVPPSLRSVRLMAGAERVVGGDIWEAGLWSAVGKACAVPLIENVTLRAGPGDLGHDAALLLSPPYVLQLPSAPKKLDFEIKPTLQNQKTMHLAVDLEEGCKFKEVEVLIAEINFPNQDEEGRQNHAKNVRELASLLPAPQERSPRKKDKGEPRGQGWMQCRNPQCLKWGRASASRRIDQDTPWFCRRRCLLAVEEGRQHVKKHDSDQESGSGSGLDHEDDGSKKHGTGGHSGRSRVQVERRQESFESQELMDVDRSGDESEVSEQPRGL